MAISQELTPDGPIKLADRAAFTVPPGFGQPCRQVLFRPEEIILPSGAALKDHRFRRDGFYQFTALEDDVNVVGAVRTGIVYHHPLIGISAADQQHEVHRSRHVEDFATAQGNGVKVEAQPAREAFVLGRKCEIAVGA